MNIKSMNKLRIFGVLMAIMVITPLGAQNLKKNGFAGDDQNIYFRPSPNNPYKEVVLGSNDPATHNENCVYNWSVVEAPDSSEYQLIGKHSYRPRLRVSMAGDYICEVVRVSEYGYQTETVCIVFASDVTLVSATSKYDCWENGDEVHPDDFDFVTSPPNFNYLVEVDDRDQIIGRYGNWYGDEEINFRIKDPETEEYTDCEVGADIYVSTGDHLDLYIWDALDDMPENLDKIKKVKDVILNSKSKAEKFLEIMELVRKFTPPTAPIEPEFRADIVFPTLCVNMSCCERQFNKIPVCFLKCAGGLDFYAGVSIRLPLFPPIPKFGLDLVGTIGVGVGATGEWNLSDSKYADCFNASIEFEARGGVTIGAQAVLFDPDVCSVDAHFYGELKGSSKVTVSPKCEFSFEGLTLSAGFSASVTFIGFNKELLNISFGEKNFMD